MLDKGKGFLVDYQRFALFATRSSFMRMTIQGGKKLLGEIRVSGSKNAAGPLIASTVLFRSPVRLVNVPRLTDVQKLLDILASMGARVSWEGEHEVVIDPQELDPTRIDQKKMKSMRFSILLLGPLLARFREVQVSEPGGCNIGNRPIDTHISVLEQMGGVGEAQEDGTLHLRAKALHASSPVMAEFSVTATENLLMAAVLAEGRTSIRLAAAEPHVQDLCHFLNASGARITGIGTHELEVEGVKVLFAPPQGWSVITDANEAATFAVAAAITHGDVKILGCIPTDMDATLLLLRRAGVQYEAGSDWLRILPSRKLKAFKLQAMIYPGFPTDNQAVFGLLATQCQGTTLLHDPLFESRLGYLAELNKMGANTIVADPHRAVVNGPTPLRGTELRSLDLRAGATMVLAGLIAEGETVIHDAEIVYRGYERLDERLRALGADIVCSDES